MYNSNHVPTKCQSAATATATNLTPFFASFFFWEGVILFNRTLPIHRGMALAVVDGYAKEFNKLWLAYAPSAK
jgi:hypothetical protein